MIDPVWEAGRNGSGEAVWRAGWISDSDQLWRLGEYGFREIGEKMQYGR